MGIPNKAFAFFTKGVGAASGFAKNHMFPAMQVDYRALKAGYTGMRRHFGGNLMGGLKYGDVGLRRGYRAMMGSYRGAGVSPMMGAARLGGYGVGAGVGMWGLNQLPGGISGARPYNVAGRQYTGMGMRPYNEQ